MDFSSGLPSFSLGAAEISSKSPVICAVECRFLHLGSGKYQNPVAVFCVQRLRGLLQVCKRPARQEATAGEESDREEELDPLGTGELSSTPAGPSGPYLSNNELLVFFLLGALHWCCRRNNHSYGRPPRRNMPFFHLGAFRIETVLSVIAHKLSNVAV